MEFILNDRLIQTDLPTGMTLLDFVRYEMRLVGTKIGCREGDCGACTVLVGSLASGDVTYQSMTSCITPLANVTGKHVVTIEGLNTRDLTPVQQAFAESGATQCGFCTVGFVVSLTGYCLTVSRPTSEGAISAMDGNICRCTGYKSIGRAASRLVSSLKGLDANAKLPWLINHGYLPEYFLQIPQRLSALTKPDVSIGNAAKGTTRVGGGTDLYVQRPERMAKEALDTVFDAPDLRGITLTQARCDVGAGTTVTDLLQSAQFNSLFPSLHKHLKLVSSTQIRNMGTLGGNLVNASPIGDMTIYFMALNSSVTLRKATGERRKVLLKEFYKKYKTIDKADDEIVETVTFDAPDGDTHFNFEKVSKRTNLDIASVNSAIRITISNGTIHDAHITAGGVSPVPLYLKKTSELLKGKKLTIQSVKEAMEVAQGEASPISDARGSMEYKSLLLRQLLMAHFIEMFPKEFELEQFA
jgi:xanthine dehydrogenase small subunit